MWVRAIPLWEVADKGAYGEKNSHIWRLGLRPIRHICGSSSSPVTFSAAC